MRDDRTVLFEQLLCNIELVCPGGKLKKRPELMCSAINRNIRPIAFAIQSAVDKFSQRRRAEQLASQTLVIRKRQLLAKAPILLILKHMHWNAKSPLRMTKNFLRKPGPSGLSKHILRYTILDQ